MPRTPYHHLMQDDADDDDDDEENVNEKFSLLLNNNEEKLKSPSIMNQQSSNLAADAGFVGIELRSRNMRAYEKSSPSRSSENSWPGGNNGDTVFVERKIRKNDSLRNLALQYGLSVAELKRANGLMSDQEFYGKDILKIPVKKYGYHHDLLSNEDVDDDGEENSKLLNKNSSSSNNKILNLHEEFVDLNFDYANEIPSTSSSSLLTSVAVAPAIERENMQSDMFLKNVDDNLLKIKTAQQELERQNRRTTDDDDPIEDMGVAIAAPIRSTWMQKNVSHFVVVVLIILIVIVIPAIIVLYKIIVVVEGPSQKS